MVLYDIPHLQVSLDGLEKSHDRLRGTGSYTKLITNLNGLQKADIPFTLSVAISSENINDLPELGNGHLDGPAPAGRVHSHLPDVALVQLLLGNGFVRMLQ